MDMSNSSMDFAGFSALPSMPPLTPLAALGSSVLTPGTLPLLVQMPDGSRKQVELSPSATVNDLRSQLDVPDDWVLNFNSEILDNSLPLNRYNIPDAYDHAGGLLKMIDTSELPLDQRLDALDKACSVVSGISRGERDIDKIVRSALTDNIESDRSINQALKTLSEGPSGIPVAPPTPSVLIRRLGMLRPDLYPPSAADRMISELSRIGTPRTVSAAVNAAANAEAAGLMGAGARLFVDAATTSARNASEDEERRNSGENAGLVNSSECARPLIEPSNVSPFCESATSKLGSGSETRSGLEKEPDGPSRLGDEGTIAANADVESHAFKPDFLENSCLPRVSQASTWFDDVMKSLLPESVANNESEHQGEGSDEECESYGSSNDDDQGVPCAACHDGEKDHADNVDNRNAKDSGNNHDGNSNEQQGSSSNTGQGNEDEEGGDGASEAGEGSNPEDDGGASSSTPTQPVKVPKKRGRKRKHPELTEEQRRALRQAQNRESAKQSRLRRKTIAADYEQKVTSLSTENDSLRKTITALGDRLQFLQGMLTVSVTQRHSASAGVPLPQAPTHPMHFAMPIQPMPMMPMSGPNGVPIPMVSHLPMDPSSTAPAMSTSMAMPVPMFQPMQMNQSAAPASSSSSSANVTLHPKM